MRWPWTKSKEPREFKAVLGTSKELGDFLIFGTEGSGQTAGSAISLYEKSTAVSIPINMVAEAFASLDPVIRFGDRNITRHKILDLLRQPSPFFTEDLFLETLGKNYLITGECYFVGLGNVNRPPQEIQPISPKEITAVEGDNGWAQSMLVSGNSLAGDYSLVLERAKSRFIDGNLRELGQVRNFSTKNNSLLRGQSPLISASNEARQHIKGNAHNLSILQNGGRISLVFHFDEDLGQEEFEEARDRVIAQYGGETKAGQIGVTAGGKLKIEELGTNNKDMDFVNLQKEAKIAVAQQYKVPIALLLADASTFNNYSEARLALYDNAVLPLADRIFGGLTNFLMPRFGLDPSRYKITYDIDQIPALVKRRNEELKLRREINIESINELREEIGKEPKPNADDVMIQSTLVVAGSDPLGPSLEDEETEPRVLRDEEDEEVVENGD